MKFYKPVVFKPFKTSIEKNNETYNIHIVLTVLIFPTSSIPAIKPFYNFL